MSLAAATPAAPKNRLARFRAVRAQLDPSGDPASTLTDFYIGGPHGVSVRVAAELAISPASSHLLIGGVGSGKTTELLAVKRELANQDDFRVIYVDVSKRHDIARMLPGAVIAQVGLALADEVEHVEPGNEYIQRARDVALGWNDSVFEDPPEEPYVHVPGLLVPPDQPADGVARARPPLERLVHAIHRDFEHVVVLLDGLDRIADVQAFEQLVLHDLKALQSLGVGAVLVGPLRALYGLERSLTDHFTKFHYQAWIDPATESGRSFLTEVLTRRAGEVLDDPGADALVLASGGVLRDLLSLAQASLVEAYIGGGESVGSHEVDAAVDAFGRKHLQGLRAGELEVLQRVRKHGTFVQTSEEDLALLMTRRVLEYRNSRSPRYAVHPTIKWLLQNLEGT